MGAAPQTPQKAEVTAEQTRDAEREWFLDTDTGELKPEEHSGHDQEAGPGPVRVARWTFD
ncbi:hypothetical protein [Streptomyces hygroscopicus]|uniref:hypothetical protein n=1 Tax=Streptomyces hygroscopicus TaxID=1912 RepID=UPI0004C7B614|nr:hypothetical protein [Streptomyces hygroscopicus]